MAMTKTTWEKRGERNGHAWYFASDGSTSAIVAWGERSTGAFRRIESGWYVSVQRGGWWKEVGPLYATAAEAKRAAVREFSTTWSNPKRAERKPLQWHGRVLTGWDDVIPHQRYEAKGGRTLYEIKGAAQLGSGRRRLLLAVFPYGRGQGGEIIAEAAYTMNGLEQLAKIANQHNRDRR